MPIKVNLDALIAKEDFEIVAKGEDQSGDFSFVLPELKHKKGTFKILRKPIFQRATSDWSPRQIVDLVKNFLDRELIPAIIVWNSSGGLQFVLDGAHRLSALVAWVNDDYGFGTVSQLEYGRDNISQPHRDAHRITQELMKDEVGSYEHLKNIGEEVGVGTELEKARTRGMNSRGLEVQHYRKADAIRAEASFYRINQGGTILTPEEREIIRTRRWPESIAARSTWRANNNRHYAIGFESAATENIEKLASEVRDLLMTPEINFELSPLTVPILSMDSGNSSIGIMDQFIHLANSLPARTNQTEETKPQSEQDPKRDRDGSKTIEYLEKAKRLAETIASEHPYSFGLHPLVYAYGKTGKFLNGAFFAEIRLIQWIEKEKKYDWFARLRAKFEEFLIENKSHISRLTHDRGSKLKGVAEILEYWKTVLNAIEIGTNPIDVLRSHSDYKSLIEDDEREKSAIQKDLETRPKRTKRIGKHAKLALKIRASWQAALVCNECHAKIYKGAWTKDHTDEGGPSHSDYLEPMHPRCNSGTKNTRFQMSQKANGGQSALPL